MGKLAPGDSPSGKRWEGKGSGEGLTSGLVTICALLIARLYLIKKIYIENKNNLLCRQLILVGIAILLS